MHYSGLLILTRTGALDGCVEALGALPGVEVHFVYPDSGRIIAVQETETARGQQEGLRRIERLPSVATAALVEHRIEPEGRSAADPSLQPTGESP